MEVRVANEADEAGIEALIRPSVLAMLGGFHSEAVLEAAIESSLFGIDRQLIQDGTYYVCVEDGRVVGCGGWSKRRREFGGDAATGEGAAELLDPSVDAARIRAFYVAPDQARRGIGSRVMAACEAAIAASAFSRVEISATLAGEKLYARFGYETVGRDELPLKDGMTVTVVRMAKKLA